MNDHDNQVRVTVTRRNGVRVKKVISKDGSTIESDCACLGLSWKVHSKTDCPNRRAAR